MSTANTLPLELIHEIFLQAAKSSTSSCHALSHVSTWARRLALPHLYTTVSTTPQSLQAFFVSLGFSPVLPPDPDFDPATSVRNIWLAFTSEDYNQGRTKAYIVRYCHNLSHIAIDACDAKHLFYAKKDQTPDLRAVDLHVLVLHNRTRSAYDSYDGCFFTYVTHLRFGDPLWSCAELPLKYMDRLTHLAVPCGAASVEELECILTAVRDTGVKVFVFIVSDAYLDEDQCRVVEDWVCEIRRADERIYLARSLYDEHKKEWDMGRCYYMGAGI
ncbi:hypothetical protein BD779DRAFT_1475754 [Infundibulicybe gibba]|nr:hypothetical protein BD779DRAFT_1475754 [Infundibulicybe gibba]